MIELKEYFLNELYEMGSGISTKPEQAGHGAPFVSFSSIYNNAILPDELPDMMDTSKEEQEKYSVKEGDIFLTRTSETLDELAMSSVAVKDYPNAAFSGFAKRLRPIQNDITYAKFMAFFMRSNYFRKIINCKATMTLRASFNEEIFSYIKVELPSYEHQVKCGDLFYAIEQKIRNNDKVNAELEKMAKTIYDYWFLQFEFPNEDGKPYKSSGGKMVWNEELKREIPEGWKVLGVGDLGTLSNGINYDKNVQGNKEYKIVNVRDISNANIFLNTNTMSNINLDSHMADKYLLKNNDILIARSGIPGAVRVLDIGDSNTIYCGFIICFSLESSLYQQYLLYTLQLYENTSATNSGGTVMQNVSQETLRNLRFVVPNEKIIEFFNKKILPFWDLMKKNNKENHEMISFRDFLLPLLMNGQIGFKDN